SIHIIGAVHELLASLTGANMETTALICDTRTAIGLALLHDSVGSPAFPNVSVTGGSIGGIPLIVSAGAPANVLAAIDGSALAKSEGGISVATSSAASIAMDDDPSADVETPTGESGKVVNLFQAESTALRTIREIGW